MTCIRDAEIDTTALGDLLQSLATSERTALADTDYFDRSWAHDVPNAPETSKGLKRHGLRFHRIVAVQNGAYVGFLAGRLDSPDGFVAIAAALNPGSGDGVGPRLLDAFSELARATGKTRLRLMPDSGNGYEDRVRFFKRYGMDWCDDREGHMCKPLAAVDTAPTN
ncbi:hypothetical protein G419_16765 [Rhodococcus triatomae BKS 15-14]|nr:hypothetical protein G419_16765 [Rhodococcus triatomae BKS 15-14]